MLIDKSYNPKDGLPETIFVDKRRWTLYGTVENGPPGRQIGTLLGSLAICNESQQRTAPAILLGRVAQYARARRLHATRYEFVQIYYLRIGSQRCVLDDPADLPCTLVDFGRTDLVKLNVFLSFI